MEKRDTSIYDCGTLASVKGITKQTLEKLNYDIILSNTYHLMLRPGLKDY